MGNGESLEAKKVQNDYNFRTTCEGNRNVESTMETKMKYQVDGYKAETERVLGSYELATKRGIGAYKAETDRRQQAIQEGKDDGRKFYECPTFDSRRKALEGKKCNESDSSDDEY